MAFLDAGAKESLSDVVSKVLRKVLSQPEGKIEELDDTLLTWEILYVLGLIMYCIHSNSYTINNYSNNFYKKTHCSSTSCIIKTLVRSILYLDNQLNKVKCNSRSMAFKLLKLRYPVYRIVWIHVDIFMKNVFYYQFINLFFYILIISITNLSQKYKFINESKSNEICRTWK